MNQFNLATISGDLAVGHPMDEVSHVHTESSDAVVTELPSLEICEKANSRAVENLEVFADSSAAAAEESARAVSLKDENEKMRQMIAHLQRYNKSLQALVEFEYPRPNQKRALLAKLETEFGISRRHACRILKLARSTFWYRSTASNLEKQIAG